MGLKEGEVRKIAGDGLSVNLCSNKQVLEITGDGCDISMSKNRGSVKVIGDGCRLRIDQNMGDVEYTGDGGQVLLGPKSIKDKVKYHGDGGRIKFDVELRMRNRKSEVSKEETGEGMDEGRGSCEESKDAAKKENSEAEKEEKKKNRRKERRDDLGGKEEKKGRSTRTKIVTTFVYDEKIVKKWFTNPETSTRTLNGVSSVRIVPHKTKTKIEAK